MGGLVSPWSPAALFVLLQRFTPERTQDPAKPQAKFSLRPEGGARRHWALRAAR